VNPHDDPELKRSLDALPRSIEPPEDVWPAVRARLAPRRGARAWRPATLRLAAGFALLAVAAGWLATERRGAAAWQLASRSADAHAVRLVPGDTLATGAGERALLRVGRIGEVAVAPQTRVRLLEARRTRQRLALDRGTIVARISAPPRLFVVETPSGTVVDLGCAYTLQVDQGGDATLRVTLGWVSSERAGRESLVPAGFHVRMDGVDGIGTPVADDAPAPLRSAAAQFDAGDSASLEPILSAARPLDAVTLWHLLARTAGARRGKVYDRLAALAPPPPGVTQAEALRLDRRGLRLWWVSLPGTLPIYPSWRTTLWTWWLKLVG
jgi:hypothetical protein